MHTAPSGALRLRAWSASERARLAAAVGSVVAEWSDSWGLPRDTAPQAVCRDATAADAAAMGWSPWRARAGAQLWWQAHADAPDWVRTQLFAVTPGMGSLAARVPGAALDNLQERLLAWTGAAPFADGPAPEPMGRWSGVLHLQLPLARLLFSGDWVAAWQAGAGPRAAALEPRRLPGLQPLGQALADQAVHLQARLAGGCVALGELAAWRLGQVVPLRHRVDQPLQLTDPDGRPWHCAWLVDLDGQRAVELAASPHLPSNTKETP